jgi:hypothetical protein
MDCRTARLLLDFHRPRAGELPPEEAADLERHLSACPECDALGRAERLADQHLGKAVRDVPVPDGLRRRLLDRLADQRRAANLRKLAWAARGLAVAAAVLLAVYSGFFWWQTHPRPFDLEGMRDHLFIKHTNPTPESVEQWFLDRDVRTVAPPAFNYTFLAHYEVAEVHDRVQDRKVPHLVFANGGVRASVYVITGEQFDLKALPEDPSLLDSAGFHVDIWPCDKHPNTRFVVFYSGGDSLDPLLAQAVVR